VRLLKGLKQLRLVNHSHKDLGFIGDMLRFRAGNGAGAALIYPFIKG
jgi:hypothetical protein